MISPIQGRGVPARAVFDTGSFYTIVRRDRLPTGAHLERFSKAQKLRTAARGGELDIVGVAVLTMSIGNKTIRDTALVSERLASEMLVGAETMQKWDITIKNRNGKTKVIVSRDMRDPEITEVD